MLLLLIVKIGSAIIMMAILISCFKGCVNDRHPKFLQFGVFFIAQSPAKFYTACLLMQKQRPIQSSLLVTNEIQAFNTSKNKIICQSRLMGQSTFIFVGIRTSSLNTLSTMKNILLSVFFLCMACSLHAEISLNLLVDCVCTNQPRQAFELTATGTAGPFTFKWSGPGGYTSTEQNPGNIEWAGTYTVEVSNAYGCITTLNETLPECLGIQVVGFGLEPNCSSNGGNILTYTYGGELPLTYEWSNGIVTDVANLYNAEAGTYTLTVTDSQGCFVEGSVVVPEPENPPFDITAQLNHACNENDGSISLDMDGIAEPYNIQWSLAGAEGAQINNLSNGNYHVTVTDANGCSDTETFVIYGAPSFDHIISAETCEPANDGYIELIPNSSPSSEEVSIQWSDGVTDVLIRDDLDAGIYAVSITGQTSNCVVVKDNLSTHPTDNSGEAVYLTALKIRAEQGASQTPIYNGYWAENATGCVEFMGGQENLNQALVDAMHDGEVKWQVTAIFNQAVENGLIVLNSSEGSASQTIDEGVSQTHTILFFASQIAQLVDDSGNLEIGISVLGTTAVGGTTLNMYDLSASLSNCVDIPSINSTTCAYEPPLDPAFLGADPTHSLSFECIDMTLSLNGDNELCLDVGATPQSDITDIAWLPYGSSSWIQTNQFCQPINPNAYGEYCVSVKTVTGCRAKICTDYCAPPADAVVPEAVLTLPSCTGANDGAICLDIPSISPNTSFVVNWDNGQTGNCIEGLAAGEYCFTMMPGGDCGLMEGYPSPPRCIALGIDNTNITIHETITPTCSEGFATGAACIYATGGTAPYNITWYDGSTDNCINEVAAGAYAYTITDACGASISAHAEVNVATEDDIQIALLGPEQNACVSHLRFFVYSPLSATVTITHEEQGHSFTQSTLGGTGGSYILFEAIPPGLYTIEVADQCHNTRTFQEHVSDLDVHLIEGIAHNGFIQCEGTTGEFTVNTTDEGTLPYDILWSNGATTATISNLEEGIYTVTVTDANGCTSNHGVTMYLNDPLSISSNEIVVACNDELNGAIDLTVEGGVPPYTFNWSNGQTQEDLNNIAEGEYCITITDAEDCQLKDCYTVTNTKFELLSADVTNHECGSGCNGAIDLSVYSSDPIDYIWSNEATTEDLNDLCAGDYDVTITTGGCVEELQYEVGVSLENEWSYEVEIMTSFDSEFNESARVRLFSSIVGFDTEGIVRVFTNASMETQVTETWWSGDGEFWRTLIISTDYQEIDEFYFTYTTNDGCEFSGTFSVPTCSWPDSDGFKFDVEYLGNDDIGYCTSGLGHSYRIWPDFPVGDNNPYFIKVTMETTSDPTQANYEQIVEYIPNSPTVINNVPSGIVRFRSYNTCSSGYFYTRLHENCCISFPCGIENQGESNQGGGNSYKYDFRYLSIHTVGSGECHDSDESNVIISPPGYFSDVENFTHTYPLNEYYYGDRCWNGDIIVSVEGEPLTEPFVMATLEVFDDDGSKKLQLVEGDNNWKPAESGVYTITISYIGTGATEGVDCEDEITFSYYGENHYASYLMIRDYQEPESQIVLTAANYGIQAYSNTKPCSMCDLIEGAIPVSSDVYYKFKLAPITCEASNGQAKYFEFQPNIIGPNACNSGGVVYYQGIDENGNGVLRTKEIAPNLALPMEDITYPTPPLWLSHLNSPEYLLACDQAGLCLFEAEDVMDIASPEDIPILVSWANVESCFLIDLETDEEAPVEEELECDEETPCPEGSFCLFGECVTENDGCGFFNPCDPGFECVNGECEEIEWCQGEYLAFYEDGGYTNPYSFVFNPPTNNISSDLYITFTSLNAKDRLRVFVDGVLYDYGCLDTSTAPAGWVQFVINDIVISGSAVITVSVEEGCGEGLDGFNWAIRCGEPEVLQEDDASSYITDTEQDNHSYNSVHTEKGIMTVYPNPFTSEMNILFNNENNAFLGVVKIINSQGKEMIDMQHDFDIGANRLQIEGSNKLHAGLYTVLVFDDNGLLASQKVIKL